MGRVSRARPQRTRPVLLRAAARQHILPPFGRIVRGTRRSAPASTRPTCADPHRPANSRPAPDPRPRPAFVPRCLLATLWPDPPPAPAILCDLTATGPLRPGKKWRTNATPACAVSGWGRGSGAATRWRFKVTPWSLWAKGSAKQSPLTTCATA